MSFRGFRPWKVSENANIYLYMNLAMKKCALKHMRPAKALIRLRLRTVWSQPCCLYEAFNDPLLSFGKVRWRITLDFVSSLEKRHLNMLSSSDICSTKFKTASNIKNIIRLWEKPRTVWVEHFAKCLRLVDKQCDKLFFSYLCYQAR